MKRFILKSLKILTILLLTLIIILVIVFYRPDVAATQLEEQYFTPYSHYYESKILDLEGNDLNIQLHYQEYGSSNDDVIVLLHGAFSSSHTFEPWAVSLTDLGYRIILVDLPYHGLSEGFIDHVTSLRRSAASIKSLLDYLDIKQIVIGGNSMGGGVSWFFTATYHNVNDFKVNGLILIDSIYPSNSYENQREGIMQFVSSNVGASIVSQMTPKFLLKHILKGVYGSSEKLTSETVTRYYDLLRKSGNRKAILVNTQEPFSKAEGLELLTFIKNEHIPTILLWGQKDTWIPVSTTSQFQDTLSLETSRIIIYEDLGHVPMEEDPLETLKDVIIFLNQLNN